MTGIPVHGPPDQGLDIAHQPGIRARMIARLGAGSWAFLRAFAGIGGEIHTVLGETSFWQSYPIVPCASILQASEEYEPLTGIQGDGQGNPIIRMKAVRQVIH